MIPTRRTRIQRLYPPPRWVEPRAGRPLRADDSLILGVAARDRSAFAELYQRWFGRLSAFLRGRTRDRAAADELTQEVFLRIWRRANTYNPSRASAATWIYTIARNASVDHHRKTSRPAPDPTDPAWVSASPLSSDEIVARREDAERVRDALDTLPPAQAEVLRHAYYHQRSSTEIAAVLGISTGTVKSRTRLALARLRRALPWEPA